MPAFRAEAVRASLAPAPEIDDFIPAAETSAWHLMPILPLRHHAVTRSVIPSRPCQRPIGHSSFIAYDIDNMTMLKNISIIHLDDAVSRVRCSVSPHV
jgi:hypothetical protein